MSGQLHAPSALSPGRELPVPSGYEAGGPQSRSERGGEQKKSRRGLKADRPGRNLVI
jgi:hypothetical protein